MKRKTADAARAGGDDQTHKGERLQKILARAGLGSRRSCEQLIVEGRVRVDGRVARELGTRADPARCRITVDGKTVRSEPFTYYIVNKPPGYVCTMESGSTRKQVTELAPDDVRVHPVGRLETDAEGLIVLTNDGSLTQMLTHPRFGIPRVYTADVDGVISEESVERLRRGVFLAEGKTLPAEIHVKRRAKRGGTLRIVIREGLNREIRRMLVAVGLKPRRIVRSGLGPLSLGPLESGAFRQLRRREVQALREAAAAREGKRPPWITRSRSRSRKATSAKGTRAKAARASPPAPRPKRRIIDGRE